MMMLRWKKARALDVPHWAIAPIHARERERLNVRGPDAGARPPRQTSCPNTAAARQRNQRRSPRRTPEAPPVPPSVPGVVRRRTCGTAISDAPDAAGAPPGGAAGRARAYDKVSVEKSLENRWRRWLKNHLRAPASSCLIMRGGDDSQQPFSASHAEGAATGFAGTYRTGVSYGPETQFRSSPASEHNPTAAPVIRNCRIHQHDSGSSLRWRAGVIEAANIGMRTWSASRAARAEHHQLPTYHGRTPDRRLEWRGKPMKLRHLRDRPQKSASATRGATCAASHTRGREPGFSAPEGRRN